MAGTTMNVGKLVTNPKMLLGVVATTVIALAIINSVAKRVPAVAQFVQGV